MRGEVFACMAMDMKWTVKVMGLRVGEYSRSVSRGKKMTCRLHIFLFSFFSLDCFHSCICCCWLITNFGYAWVAWCPECRGSHEGFSCFRWMGARWTWRLSSLAKAGLHQLAIRLIGDEMWCATRSSHRWTLKTGPFFTPGTMAQMLWTSCRRCHAQVHSWASRCPCQHRLHCLTTRQRL